MLPIPMPLRSVWPHLSLNELTEGPKRPGGHFATCRSLCKTRILPFAWTCFVLISFGCACAYSGTCLADEAHLNEALSQIRSYKADRGVAPNFDYYYTSIVPGCALTNPEQTQLYLEIRQQQEPPISSEELITILKAKRDSVASFKCQYTYRTNEKPEASSRTYAFSGNRILTARSRPSSKSRDVSAYDGELVREVFYRDQQMTNARIKELESLSMFFKPIMPLCQAMMFNTELTARPSTAADLAQWLDDPARVQVFEATETIDGRNCLLLGSSATQIYLDMDRTFALVRVDTYRLERKEAPDKHGLTTIKGRWLKGRRTASDFQDYGNGIWLPNRTELVHFDKDGKILAEKTTRVQNMEINPILDDGFFSEIIPEDAFVVDGVRNMTYVYGERASIGGLLRDTVPSKTTTRLRWISVCAGLMLIALVISMTIRKAHMRRKGI